MDMDNFTITPGQGGEDEAPASATVCVDKIISDQGGGVILRGPDINTGESIVVIVPYSLNPGTPCEGETLYVEGRWKWWEKGQEDQLQATLVYPVRPSRDTIVEYLSRSKRMRGLRIGPKRASELRDTFGAEQLIDILKNGDVERLCQVLKRHVAEALVARWAEHSQETDVVGWLQQNRLDPRIAVRFIRWGKGQSLDMLRKNPYRLVAFIGSEPNQWNILDQAGQGVGIAPDDPRRTVAGVEHALYTRHDRGHTRSEASDLKPMLLRRLGSPLLVSKALQDAMEAGKLVANRILGGFQHFGAARMEQHASQRLQAMIAGEQLVQRPLFPIRVTDDDLIASVIANEEARLKFAFAEEQVQAIRMAAMQPVSAMLGGAGCGKSAAVGAIYRIHEAIGIPVYQMALAGRATQRLRVLTKREAHTIAGFVAGVADERIRIPPGSFIIIDESSMLDLCTTIRVLRCLPPGCRILLVGDPYQLGPIGMGLVLHVLARYLPRGMVTELTQIQRADETTGIPGIARAIRNGIVPDIPAYDKDAPGVSFLECPLHPDKTPEEIYRVHTELNQAYLKKTGDPVDDQVLSMIKDGSAGVHWLNDYFQDRRGTARDGVNVGGRKFFVDDKVMYLANDYDKGLYNGSMGIVTRIGEDSQGTLLTVTWDDGETRAISDSDAENIQLSYSATVHKYQGSQCAVPIIPMYENGLLDRAAVYTAMTRGIDRAVFVGSRDALRKAVEGVPLSHKRKVGLML